MSVRMRSTGPAPFRSTPTTPVPPNFSVTSKLAARNSAATLAAVFSSMSESSGWACRPLYRVSSDGYSEAIRASTAPESSGEERSCGAKNPSAARRTGPRGRFVMPEKQPR